MRTEAARASGSASRSKRSQANKRASTDAPSKERAQRRSRQRLFGGEGQAPSEPATTTAQHVFVNRSLDATPNRLESPLQPRRPRRVTICSRSRSRPSNCRDGRRILEYYRLEMSSSPASSPKRWTSGSLLPAVSARAGPDRLGLPRRAPRSKRSSPRRGAAGAVRGKRVRCLDLLWRVHRQCQPRRGRIHMFHATGCRRTIAPVGRPRGNRVTAAGMISWPRSAAVKSIS
jgi:hypothetical protein